MKLPYRSVFLLAIYFLCGFLLAFNVHHIFHEDQRDNENDIRMLRRRSHIHQHPMLKLLTMKPTLKLKFTNRLFEVQGNFSLAPLTHKVALFPDEADDKKDDRIWNQMRYIPKKSNSTKRILLFNGMGNEPTGRARFLKDNCPVSNCVLDSNRKDSTSADVILWQHSIYHQPFGKRPKHQVWAIFMLESPHHTGSLAAFADDFNWTATYRHDSVIVAPYFKFTPYDFSVRWKKQTKNYAQGKTKKVAWFVSNCGAHNQRLQYAHELAKYIEVDIYGGCGTKTCPRFQSNSCFEMLNRDYKFYLAFENSNCRDYITEKFFLNGLSQNVLPIVMGAHPEDYKRVAPYNSFIHVDHFQSARDLAQYLHHLDRDDALYNEYFAWKGTGLVDTNTFFWCRLCAMAHVTRDYRVPDVESFWRGKDVCVDGNWPTTISTTTSEKI